MEFRRLAAHLYKVSAPYPFLTPTWLTFGCQKNGKWEESSNLSKQDKLYKDAMITAAASASTEVSEELLSYFVDIGNKECSAAMLYICVDSLLGVRCDAGLLVSGWGLVDMLGVAENPVVAKIGGLIRIRHY